MTNPKLRFINFHSVNEGDSMINEKFFIYLYQSTVWLNLPRVFSKSSLSINNTISEYILNDSYLLILNHIRMTGDILEAQNNLNILHIMLNLPWCQTHHASLTMKTAGCSIVARDMRSNAAKRSRE